MHTITNARTSLIVAILAALSGCKQESDIALAEAGAESNRTELGIDADAPVRTHVGVDSTSNPALLAKSSVAAGGGGTDTKQMYRPIEASILHNGAIDMAVQKQLEAEGFDDFMNKFEQENASNLEAQQLTKLYRGEIEHTLSAVPDSRQFTRFACGSNVCMGYVSAENGSRWFDDWYSAFSTVSEHPIKAMTYGDFVGAGGVTEHRILFSTQGDAVIYSRR